MAEASPIHSISLRRWLPALVVFAVGAVILVFTAVQAHSGWQRLQAEQRGVLRLMGAQTVLPLKRALESGQTSDTRALVSSLALYDPVDWVILSDDQGRVLESSRYAWRGRPLEQVLPRGLQFLTPDNDRGLVLARRGDHVYGVDTIDYRPEDAPQSARKAWLWIALDTTLQRQGLIAQLARDAALGGALGLIALALTLWLVRRYLTLPLNRLVAAAGEMARGRLDRPIRAEGRGEVAELARAMDHMAGELRAKIEALRESEERLSITLDAIGDAVLVTDPQGLITRLNPVAEQLTGWRQEEALGRPVLEVFHIVNTETREPAEHPVGRVLREGIVVGLANHTTLIARDGTEYQIADSAAPIRDAHGQIVGVIMVFQDVTERYALESAMRQMQERLQAILESLPDLCLVLDGDGRYLEILGGPIGLLARSPEDLIGRRVQDVLPPEEAIPILRTVEEALDTGVTQRLEYTVETPGGVRHFEGSAAPIRGAEPPAVVWLARDITERKRAEEQLHHLARYDPLTGLANRTLTSARIQQALARNRRRGHFGALMFIDIDRFKHINDSLGHQAGDLLLTRVAEILRSQLRGEDLAARFGGDEFIVVLEDLGADRIAATQRAEAVAEKLRQACAEPIPLGDQVQQITLSIGIVLFPENGSDVEELLKRADIAMYKAKEGGRNRICFFSPELQEIAEARLNIQRGLRRALREDHLVLYVQPRVDGDGRWVGGEVLVRWDHPERGLILPGGFIPVAEATGLIEELDSWVISHAVTGLGRLQGRLPEGFTLNVNITADLLNPRFPEEVRTWCLHNAVPPECLSLEITERVLLTDHGRAAQVIEALRGAGFRFAIDDFGTGCSSLRYLQRLPIQALKIDRSFVERLPGHAGDASLVSTILEMARRLGLEVVAEGVEHEAQRDFLHAVGCGEFQGFLFAPPLPWDEFFTRLEREGAPAQA